MAVTLDLLTAATGQGCRVDSARVGVFLGVGASRDALQSAAMQAKAALEPMELGLPVIRTLGGHWLVRRLPAFVHGHPDILLSSVP